MPSPGMYTESSATWATAPQLAHVPTAVVMSVPNTSISMPPIALPSSANSSTPASATLASPTPEPPTPEPPTAAPEGPPAPDPSKDLIASLQPQCSLPGGAEPFRLDPPRRIPEPDQDGSHRLHEVRRPADVDQRHLRHRPGHLGQHLLVHPAGVAPP